MHVSSFQTKFILTRVSSFKHTFLPGKETLWPYGIIINNSPSNKTFAPIFPFFVFKGGINIQLFFVLISNTVWVFWYFVGFNWHLNLWAGLLIIQSIATNQTDKTWEEKFKYRYFLSLIVVLYPTCEMGVLSSSLLILPQSLNYTVFILFRKTQNELHISP